MTRKEFIAYTTSRAITHLGANAATSDFPEAVKRAQKLADILEQLGDAPWREGVPTTEPAGAPEQVNSQAEENTRRLLAVAGSIGSPQNPAGSGAVIAAMGEAQPVRQTVLSTPIQPANIISDIRNP